VKNAKLPDNGKTVDEIRSASLYARSLLEASLDPLVTISAEGKITDVNKATEQVTGSPREQLIGSDFSDYFTEPEKARASYKQVFTAGFVKDYPLAIRHTSGKITDVLYNATVYRDETGKIQGVFAAARDVTERKRIEKALRDSEHRWSTTLASIGDAVIATDIKGNVTFINHVAENLTGWSIDDGKNVPLREVFHIVNESTRKEVESPVIRVLREGLVIGLANHTILIRKDGGEIPIDDSGAPIKDKDGKLTGVVLVFRDIRERKEADDKLQAISLYSRSLLEASLDPLVTISAEGKITDANKAAEDATGFPREQLIGSDFSSYFTDSEKARKGYLKVFSEGFVRDYPLAIRHKSGRIIDVLYNASIYRNQQGKIQGVFASARDITERKKAEEKYRSLFETIDEGFCIVEMVFDDACKPLDYRFLEVNESFERQTGLHDAKGKLMRTLTPNHEEYWFQIYGKVALTGEPVRFTNEAKALNRWYDVYAFPIGEGKIKNVAILFNDVTERKLTEQKLLAASLYSRSLLEANLDPLVTISADGKITDVNESTEEATGYTRKEIIGSDFSDYFTEPQKARIGYQKVFTEGFVRDYPLAICHKSGRVTEVLYNATIYRNQNGEIQGVFAAARDITERKLAEQKLLAASMYSRSLLEASLDPLVTISKEGKITDVNKATEDVTGCTREELIGSDFSDYFTEPNEARASYQKVFTEGLVKDYPLAILHKSGRITDVLYNASVYLNPQGEIQGVFAAARDITERKAMENEIKQTLEKLKQSNAELEQFAYVASHDLQEPLRMVASYVQLIERRYKGKLDKDADEFIGYAVDGANRMRGLIDDLLTYSRVSRLGKPFESTDVESTLDIALLNLKASITENHAVVTHDKLPVVMADGGQLVQLLQNLIGNAIKFHGKEPPRVHVSSHDKRTEYVFSIRDNGIGISPEYYDRLFKIFQRLHTREEYPGSGIGLAVCKRIVERHGGRIWIESQVGKGSIIYFTLNKKGVDKTNEKT
jgi:PAS domain S-box-containing protein